jgi:hypothetical protein
VVVTVMLSETPGLLVPVFHAAPFLVIEHPETAFEIQEIVLFPPSTETVVGFALIVTLGETTVTVGK